jgi:hypothetical protein
MTNGLCPTCAFVQIVRGRHGQAYLLCRSGLVQLKYPPQPVLACPGFTASAGS